MTLPHASQFVAFVERLKRYLRVRQVVVAGADLVSVGGVIIRSAPSSLQARADCAAEQGLVKVREHLARLRARGAIDSDSDGDR